MRQVAKLLNMLFCAAGIYVCFFYWGIVQERVVTKRYLVNGVETKFSASAVLGLIQAVCAGTVGLVFSLIASLRGSADFSSFKQVPWSKIALLGFSVFVAPQFGFAAMQRIPYPMAVTVKMCKMVPILFVGYFWHRHRYPLSKVLNVLTITAGVVGMVLLAEESHTSSKKAEKSSSYFGIALVFINLIFDGYTNSSQDAICHKYKLSGMQMMFLSNFALVAWSVVYLGGMEALSSIESIDPALAPYVNPQFGQALAFFQAAPEAFWDLLTMGLFGASGQYFIFRAIGAFGSLTMTALTLTRKVGSVFISIFANDHQLVIGQWVSLALVVVGVILDTWYNIRDKRQKSADTLAHEKHVASHKEQKKKK